MWRYRSSGHRAILTRASWCTRYISGKQWRYTSLRGTWYTFSIFPSTMHHDSTRIRNRYLRSCQHSANTLSFGTRRCIHLALPCRARETVSAERVCGVLFASDNLVVTSGRRPVDQSKQLFQRDEGSVDISQMFHHFNDCLLFSHSRSSESVIASFNHKSFQPLAAMVMAVDSTTNWAQFGPNSRSFHVNGTRLLAPL